MIAKGRKTEESGFKRFIGIDNFHVLGVNPDKATLNSWGIMVDREPEYHGTQEDRDGNSYRYARCSFYIKSVKFPDFVTSITFFLREQFNRNKEGNKMQAIDIYGNTAWLTADDAKNKRVPVYANGTPAFVNDFRAAYRGEEDLTNFIRNLLNIPGSHNYINGSWELKKENLEQSLCTLANIKDYFNGDFTELQEIVKYQPENEVKLLCGIKSGTDGKLRQDVFTGLTARAFDSSAVQRFQKEVNSSKSAGGLQNVEYEFVPLHEWTLKTASQEEVEKTIEDSGSAFDDDEDDLPFN